MQEFCETRRVPRAGLDPIRSARAALGVVNLARSRPAACETIVVVLDADRCGRSIVVVEHTSEPNSFVEVVERLAWIAAAQLPSPGLVVASVRPGGGVVDGDDCRWLEASDAAESVGVELVEWFVIGDGAAPVCPRDLLADPPRW